MDAREHHWRCRTDIDPEELQPGHTGCDRARWQGQHDASDSDAVRLNGRGGNVHAFGDPTETSTLQCLQRHPKSVSVSCSKGLPVKCLRYHGRSHQDTLRPPRAPAAGHNPICG
jgi:hypothetical protein